MGGIVKGLFGGGDQPAPIVPPTVAPPTPMPTPNDEAQQAAKRRALAAQQARRGRQSTILANDSADGDTLGG